MESQPSGSGAHSKHEVKSALRERCEQVWAQDAGLLHRRGGGCLNSDNTPGPQFCSGEVAHHPLGSGERAPLLS